jgi:hypothetical protein
MRKLIEMRPIMALWLMVSYGAIAYGSTAKTDAKIGGRIKVVKTILQKTSTVDQVITMMAFTDASTETLRTIRQELAKRVGKAPLPKFDLIGDEFTVGGNRSDLHLISVEPFRMKFKDRVWTYDKEKDLNQNYLSLVSLVNDTSTSFQSILIDRAYADPVLTGIGYTLLGVGTIAGVACAIAEPCPAVILGSGILYGSAGAVTLTANASTPRRVAIQCYPTSSPPVIIISSSLGQTKLIKSGDGYKAFVQRGRGQWTDGSKIVEEDPAGFDYLAALIGKDTKKCKEIEYAVNEKLETSYESGKSPTPLGGAINTTDPKATQ